MNNKNNNMKHLLFYSNLCNYSQEVYNKITKFNIKDKFYLINISSNKYKIPSNIKLVPTILLNDKQTILTGNELNNFIDKLYNKNKITIDPFTNVSGISNEFSFLDSEELNNNMTSYFGLTNENHRIETPNEDSGKGKSVSISDNMSRMQEDRNLEIQNIFNTKKNNLKN